MDEWNELGQWFKDYLKKYVEYQKKCQHIKFTCREDNKEG
jgi:hypothetical protein